MSKFKKGDKCWGLRQEGKYRVYDPCVVTSVIETRIKRFLREDRVIYTYLVKTGTGAWERFEMREDELYKRSTVLEGF